VHIARNCAQNQNDSKLSHPVAKRDAATVNRRVAIRYSARGGHLSQLTSKYGLHHVRLCGSGASLSFRVLAIAHFAGSLKLITTQLGSYQIVSRRSDVKEDLCDANPANPKLPTSGLLDRITCSLPVNREQSRSLPTSRLPGTDRPLPAWTTSGLPTIRSRYKIECRRAV
jgi:hypothetical protein